MKNKAFKFYFQDFLIGTDNMSLTAVGAYIKCLCHQADKGFITQTHMNKICETHLVMEEILPKFEAEQSEQSETLYYNCRLRIELDKRLRYSESRSKNRKGARYDQIMSRVKVEKAKVAREPLDQLITLKQSYENESRRNLWNKHERELAAINAEIERRK